MTEPRTLSPAPDTPRIYRICVQERLDRAWAGWFDAMTLTVDAQQRTLLTGPVVDQAALYGQINKLRDLGLTLISVHPIDGE